MFVLKCYQISQTQPDIMWYGYYPTDSAAMYFVEPFRRILIIKKLLLFEIHTFNRSGHVEYACVTSNVSVCDNLLWLIVQILVLTTYYNITTHDNIQQ